jgi:hypothetical protein
MTNQELAFLNVYSRIANEDKFNQLLEAISQATSQLSNSNLDINAKFQQGNLLIGNANSVGKIIRKIKQSFVTDFLKEKQLHKLSFGALFSDEVINFYLNLNEITDTNRNDIIAKLNQYYGAFSILPSLLSYLQALRNNLNELNTNEPEINQLIICFDNKAEINFLSDFTNKPKEWKFIINSFGRITKETESDPRVVTVESGCLIIGLATTIAIIRIVIKASDMIHDSILKHIEVRKNLLNLKNQKLDHLSDLLDALDKKSKMNLNQEAETIADKLLADCGWKDENNLKEVKNFAIKAIKKLVTFINNGGKVFPKLIETSNDDINIIESARKSSNRLIEAEKEIKKISGDPTLLLLDEVVETEGE